MLPATSAGFPLHITTMFSRLVGKALVKLDIKDSEKQVAAKAAVLQCPNLAFPPPPHGTSSICARCLTLLSHFVYLFGDGVDYQPLSIMHSSAIRDVSHAVESNNAVARQDANECLICVKVFILFKAMQSHVSFEESWRESSSRDWNLSWAVGLHSYETGHQGRLHVKFNVEHKGGYTWGLGSYERIVSKDEANFYVQEDSCCIPIVVSFHRQRNKLATLMSTFPYIQHWTTSQYLISVQVP